MVINMNYRNLCGEKVFPLGFGCMRFPMKDGTPDIPETKKIIRHAIDEGLNYIDTAYFYHDGKSEEILSEVLADGYREKVFLATKMPLVYVKCEEDFDRIFNEQLERLKTDYIDFYLLHAVSLERWDNLVLKFGLIEKMQKLKREGKVKHIGFSFHDTVDAFKRIVTEYDGCEFCQIQLNYIDVNNQAGMEGLEFAYKKGLSVVIMEPLLGGKLASPGKEVMETLGKNKTAAKHGFDFLWDRKEISVVLSGMSSAEQVEENLKSAKECKVGMLSEKEKEAYVLSKKMYDSKKPISCTACNYCMPCPVGIDIPGTFKFSNDAADKNYFEAKSDYISLGSPSDKCVSCKACESQCPQKLQISKLMKLIKESYE